MSGVRLIQSLNLSFIEVFIFLLFLIKSDSQQFNVRCLKGLKIEVNYKLEIQYHCLDF